MTIEEYIAEEHNSRYASRKAPVEAREVKVLGFVAEPSRVWSEYTSESFSARLRYEVQGKERELWLGEDDVCNFLNKMFPPAT